MDRDQKDRAYKKKLETLSQMETDACGPIQTMHVQVVLPILVENVEKAQARKEAARADLDALHRCVHGQTATHIQRCFRGILTRKRIENYKAWLWGAAEFAAAIQIQRIQRGIVGRVAASIQRTKRRHERETHARETLQRTIRGHLGRCKAFQERRDREMKTIFDAATKIQVMVRIFLAQRLLVRLHAGHTQLKYEENRSVCALFSLFCPPITPTT